MNDPRSAGQRWERLEALFDEAVTLPPHLRAELLAQRAGNDEHLLQEVQALLKRTETRGDLFDLLAADNVARRDPLAGLESGTRIGVWRIESLVGRGGTGEVYCATRADAAFQQQVALKLVRREAVDPLEGFHEAGPGACPRAI